MKDMFVSLLLLTTHWKEEEGRSERGEEGWTQGVCGSFGGGDHVPNGTLRRGKGNKRGSVLPRPHWLGRCSWSLSCEVEGCCWVRAGAGD